MSLRLAQLELTLRDGGLASALNYLNCRVSYRFTTVYRLQNQLLKVVETVDKLNESRPCPGQEKPLNESLCRLAVAQGIFTSSNTAADPHLAGAIYPSEVGSYSGVRLTLENGEVFGTLCHHDLVPRSISHMEYHFLELAAKTIARYLQQTMGPEDPAHGRREQAPPG